MNNLSRLRVFNVFKSYPDNTSNANVLIEQAVTSPLNNTNSNFSAWLSVHDNRKRKVLDSVPDNIITKITTH